VALAQAVVSEMANSILSKSTSLDRTSDVPLHAQLADHIGNLIHSGRVAPGQLLPAELDVGAHFDVSRITVRQAMAKLVADGLISRRRGSGTYVRGNPVTHHFAHSFEDELLAEHADLKLTIKSWKKVIPPRKVQQVFGTSRKKKFYRIERLKLVDGKPIGWELRYMPHATGDSFNKTDLETKPIYQLLFLAGLPQVQRIVSTVLSLRAPPKLAKLLQVRKNEPLLVREQTYLSANSVPLMHGIVAFIGERYRFVFECGPDQLRMDISNKHPTLT
jgi:GntR family transcriptional regulator